MPRALPRLLTLALAATLAACGGAADSAPQAGGTAPAGESAGAATTRPFTDDAGRVVQIPVRPRRIVAIHDYSSAPALLSIGAPLVGVPKRDGAWGDELKQYDLSKVTSVGEFPDLQTEKIASVEPDLIIGLAAKGKPTFPDPAALPKYEAVAPTVVLDQNVPVDTFMAKIGEAAGMQSEVAAQKKAYDEARTAFLARHRDVRGKLSWAELGYFEPTFYDVAPGHPSPLAHLANDLGLLYPPCYKAPTDVWCELTAETMKRAEADIVMWTAATGDPTHLPLWKDLAAVKAGKVVHLDDFPAGGNYAAYRRTMKVWDDVLATADPKIVDESTWTKAS